MYTAFYGLREKPFALSPDPRFLFLAEPHREALAHLLYGVEQGEGFIAVTGEVGTGKTTLCRTLIRRLGPDLDVAFLFNPNLSARELLQAIHAELGIEGAGEGVRELVEALNRTLLAKRHEGKRVLLIVDEAQGLPPDTLEQIRLLSNLETETDKLLQILLLGQPELDSMLESPSLRQLRQRIAVRWRLAPLSARETRDYVRHRLRVAAGEERDLFTERALREVHRRSRGIPRLVNLVCDRALLAGYALEAKRIGPRLVRRADRELRAASVRAGRPRLRQALVAAVLLLALGGIAWRLVGAPWPWVGAWPLRAAESPPAYAAERLPATKPQPPAPVPLAQASAPGAIATPAPTHSAEPPALEPSEPPAPLDPEAPAPPPTAVQDLALALARRPPGETAAGALHGVLAAWGVETELPTASPVSFPKLLGALTVGGLGVLPLPRADLDTLRVLDHPALLEVEAADGVGRVVAVSALSNDEVELFGVEPDGPVRVAAEELQRSWRGEAYVVWRDFERLPEIVQDGDAGPAVTWLQRSLGELGFYSGAPTGSFDAATLRAVRAFQIRRVLAPDGRVGPLTKMALYDALERYMVPRLRLVGEEAG